MRRKWQRAKPKVEKIQFITGARIMVPRVFLIDENGEQVGEIDRNEALNRAREVEMDLVLVNPKADPPVAKILDLGQMKYEMEKKMHKQKVQQKKIEMKELRLSIRISDHDFEMRTIQAEKFLKKDQKLKIEIILKGREKQHPKKAFELINKFTSCLKEKEDLNVFEEQPLTRQGGRFNIVLANKKD